MPPAAVEWELIPEDPIPGKPLGRNRNHDPRSRAYAIQAAPLSELRSVRHRRRVRPYDQGELGACTGMSAAGALSTGPWLHKYHETTARRLYSDATRLDPWEGAWPPDDTGSSGLAVAQACKNRGLIGRYEHAFSLEAALTALTAGPVITGIGWRSGCDTPRPDGQVLWVGATRGGHEICLDEIDVEQRRVWLTNSWSASWGLSGRAWLSWDHYGQALDDNGDATTLLR